MNVLKVNRINAIVENNTYEVGCSKFLLSTGSKSGFGGFGGGGIPPSGVLPPSIGPPAKWTTTLSGEFLKSGRGIADLEIHCLVSHIVHRSHKLSEQLVQHA